MRFNSARVCAAIFVIGLVAVIVLTLLPRSEAIGFAAYDKLRHAAAYAALGLFGGIALRSYIWPLLGTLAVLGLGLEVAQLFVPGRSFEWGDEVANVAGAGLGLWLAWLTLEENARATRANLRRCAVIAGLCVIYWRTP